MGTLKPRAADTAMQRSTIARTPSVRACGGVIQAAIDQSVSEHAKTAIACTLTTAGASIARPCILFETSLSVKSDFPFLEKRKNSISSPRALRHRALEVMHRPGQAPCHLRFLSLTSALAALSHARSRWPSRVRCEACSANSRVRGPDRGARNRGYVRAALLCAGITEAY